ncbi:arginine--tRNA ligase [soil metagenome]
MIFTTILNVIEEVVVALGFSLPEGILATEPPAHVGGDVSVNVAMLLAKQTGANPREVAEKLAEALRSHEKIAEVTIAGPGFLNLVLTDQYYREVAFDLALGGAEGVRERLLLPEGERKKVSVEFVSANPSGPLHIGNARGGPLGEAISRVLAIQGHTVTREFYVNNIGGQANRFAASVLHFYAAKFGTTFPFPEDGYQGDYVKELAESIAATQGSALIQGEETSWVEAMRKVAIGEMVENTKTVVGRMGVVFDLWFWENTMKEDGAITHCLELLEKNQATVQKDGALWLKSGFQDDDRETVLVKSDGTTTYFMNDLAYHVDKLQKRGNDYAVCLLGADHSGHPPRMRAGMEALGLQASQYRAVVYQYVQLKKDGQMLDMSKRSGKFVSAAEVLNEVPRDVFVYFMVSKANETHVDFDLQLAKDTSEKNPVYSIQYAHARIASLITRAAESSLHPGAPAKSWSETERRLVRQLSSFQTVVAEAAQSYRINLLCQYLQELAARYHQFYAHSRVIDAEHPDASASRLALSEITLNTIKLGLNLLNIEAPDSLSREVAS